MALCMWRYDKKDEEKLSSLMKLSICVYRKRYGFFCFCHIVENDNFPLYKAADAIVETAVFHNDANYSTTLYTYVSLRTILYLYQGKVLTRAYIQAGTTENWIDTEAI